MQFKGKTIIWNHHLSIPYHTLEKDKKRNFQDDASTLRQSSAQVGSATGDGNLIIKGDNLLALKALLPQYAGRIKCIYIDPPYNTGEENWIYNDNVNSPRLKLLCELLSDDGVLFIFLNDIENH